MGRGLRIGGSLKREGGVFVTFRGLVNRRSLQVILRIAIRCVLHRCVSQDIHR
ncbi:hypothetical protein BBBOND_0208170 [Babesia bigemina]|uniref:Uncharacterized protein n=1 Tax=Babesia bigemina TaxID=5866 RepID=A0A061D521_BABBI|nr:hypothetical protein BBBOND_0208170 [Babesia bigemina]CDR95663.1 hypothetical protein BBBOND_0208170 [Babesia bigemina]|eukprot:XP_012767849.1 hypothetical protein BBBOND_0208170 [Babesia bigemina]